LLACLFEIEPSNTSSVLVPLSVHAASDHVSSDDLPVCVKPTKKTCLRLPCRRTPMHYGGAQMYSTLWYLLSLLLSFSCLLFITVLLS